MTTLTIDKALIRVLELVEEGNDLKRVRAYLTLDGYKVKIIESALKELGLKTKRGASFAASYYDWLVESSRTRLEAEDYIKGDGDFGETSKNVINHLTHYINIWELAERVRKVTDNKEESEKEPKDDSKADNEKESDYTDKIKEARNRLDKAIKAYSKGNAPKNIGQFHPDKISYLGDDSLTRAYTKFFQELSD